LLATEALLSLFSEIISGEPALILNVHSDCESPKLPPVRLQGSIESLIRSESFNSAHFFQGGAPSDPLSPWDFVIAGLFKLSDDAALGYIVPRYCIVPTISWEIELIAVPAA